MSGRSGDGPHLKIGVAAELVGVKPHVLRYWELEFPMFRPKKTRGAHRMYSPHDVELAQMIRRLLHDEGYTVAGARRQLAAFVRQRRRSEQARRLEQTAPIDIGARRAPPPTKIEIVREEAARELGYRKELVGLRRRLNALLGELDRIDEKLARPEHTATIERVVPSSVPVRRR